MTEIRFYHLQRQKPLQALVSLIERASSRNQIILVKAKDKQEADVIDAYLWTYQAESFLPHATSDQKNAESQSILISASADNKNNATTLFHLNEEPIAIPDGVTLCCKIFDGANESDVLQARTEWKRLKESGHELSYWQQDDEGKWAQKA